MNCFGCMNSDRKMFHIKTEKERECFLQIIKNIPMPLPENLMLYLCWECTALLVRFSKFKDQVMQSYKLLNDIKSGSPNNLYKPQTRLKMQDLFNLNYKPDKATDCLVEAWKRNNEDLEYTEIELSAEELHEERKNLANQEDYINALFRCDKCITSFPNADNLSDHISMKHERNASLFKCKICECSFSSEASYTCHMNRHTKRYQCMVCSDKFPSKISVVKHYNTTHGLGDKTSTSFTCEFCSKTFLWRASLRNHVERHRIANGQKQRPYCELCKLSFSTTLSLQKHVKKSSKHHVQLNLRKLKETLPENSDSPEKQRQRIEQVRSAVNSVRQQFPCGQCGKRFQWRWNLLRHMESHAVKAKGGLVCVPCNQRFSSNATYRLHMTGKKHAFEGDYKFMCSECGKRFANKTRLKDHVDWEHLKNYVHKCDVCQKAFNSHKYLNRHKLMVHNKEHLCDLCGIAFPWRTSLKKHMETHLIENGQKRRPYCEPCKLPFTSTANLQKHVKTSSKHQIQLKLRKLKETLPEGSESPEKQRQRIEQVRSAVNSVRQQFSCGQCGKMFQWRCNLLRHTESHAVKAKGGLVCEPCNRSFSSIATYKQHMTISKKHVSKDNFKFTCSDCDKRFVTKRQLKDHVDCEHLVNCNNLK